MIGKEKPKNATELAYAEVISYNKKILKGKIRMRTDSKDTNENFKDRVQKLIINKCIEKKRK